MRAEKQIGDCPFCPQLPRHRERWPRSSQRIIPLNLVSIWDPPHCNECKVMLAVHGLDIEGAMKNDYEQAVLAVRRLVQHCLSSREMRIGERSDYAVVGLESTFKDDDGVRCCMPVQSSLGSSGITYKVVLFA